jgi:hypothetical protein
LEIGPTGDAALEFGSKDPEVTSGEGIIGPTDQNRINTSFSLMIMF